MDQTQTRWIGGGQFTELADHGTYDVQDVRHPPGEQTPLHRHTRYGEHVYVISGSVEAWIGDQHLRIGPGQSVDVPIGVVHAMRIGPEGAHTLVVSQPAGFAGVVRSGAADAPEAFDPEAFGQAAVAAGDELLGTPGMTPSDL